MRKYVTPKRIIMTLAFPVAVILGWFGFNQSINTVYYTLTSDKLTDDIRLVHVSDLHGTVHGIDQEALLEKIRACHPDIIIMTGDMADDIDPLDGTIMLMKELPLIAPSYYVSGNHEWWHPEIDTLFKAIAETGVTMLDDRNEVITVKGQSMTISGFADPYKFGHKEAWREAGYEQVKSIDEKHLSILLSHRPEEVEYYKSLPIDVIFSGHAHGGQVRIPGLINGLFSPNQGLFPKYAGGNYLLDLDTRLIVSRGLSINPRLPRIFNPPELVIVDLKAQ